MTDNVAILLKLACDLDAKVTYGPSPAAEAIRAVLTENSELRSLINNSKKALVPFAATAEHDMGCLDSDTDTFVNMRRHNLAPKITNGDLRYAQAALLELDNSPIFDKKV